MVLKIESTNNLIFEQYLTIINTVLSKSRLSKTECKVLGKILLVYNMYVNTVGEEKANEIVFLKETRKRIQEAIGNELGSKFSNYSYNNSVGILRKKGFITYTKVIHKVPIKNGKIDITFSLNVKDVMSNE